MLWQEIESDLAMACLGEMTASVTPSDELDDGWFWTVDGTGPIDYLMEDGFADDETAAREAAENAMFALIFQDMVSREESSPA